MPIHTVRRPATYLGLYKYEAPNGLLNLVVADNIKQILDYREHEPEPAHLKAWVVWAWGYGRCEVQVEVMPPRGGWSDDFFTAQLELEQRLENVELEHSK